MSHYLEDKMDLIKSRIKYVCKMENEYLGEITICNEKSIIYNDNDNDNDNDKLDTSKYRPIVYLENQSLVEAILSIPNGESVTVLNGGSFYFPARKFLAGELFDEENLCDNSYLYNVLKRNEAYYDQNSTSGMKNHELYTNRALLVPNVRFGQEETNRYANVITCTPPKKTVENETDNSKALMERINFIKEIVKQNPVDTLIIGTFGTERLYNQDVSEVVGCFKNITRYLPVKKIIFAINDKNLYDEYVKQDFFYYCE